MPVGTAGPNRSMPPAMIDRSIHPNTRVLLDAWRRMNASPQTHALSGPSARDHAHLLDRIFVLEGLPDSNWRVRSAGENLPDLLGRDLTNHSFLELWTGPDRAMMASFLDAVRLEGAPGVVRGRGETITGQRVELEITLMPLETTQGRPAHARMLGLYQTLGGEGMLGGRPIWRHRIAMLVPPLRRNPGPALQLVASNR